jgi:ketosteroid isomerase-like protein
LRAGALAIALFGGAAVADVDSGTNSSPKEAVRRVMREADAAMASGAPAAKISAILYSSDVVIVGEGDKGAQRGMKAATADVEGFIASLGPNGGKSCKSESVDPIVSSKNTYASFMLIHCDANPPTLPDAMDVRCLYVWKKLPQGWRVVLEQWGVGKL